MKIFSITNDRDLSLDYDQDGNVMKWHPDKQGKRKKKIEGSTNVESTTTGTGTIDSLQ